MIKNPCDSYIDCVFVDSWQLRYNAKWHSNDDVLKQFIIFCLFPIFKFQILPQFPVRYSHMHYFLGFISVIQSLTLLILIFCNTKINVYKLEQISKLKHPNHYAEPMAQTYGQVYGSLVQIRVKSMIKCKKNISRYSFFEKQDQNYIPIMDPAQ